MERITGFAPDQLDVVFELLGRLADVFVVTLGGHTEIVIHDLRSIESSVVAIAGNLTSRKVGAPIPDPEFLPARLETMGEDERLYLTQTHDGRPLCSSTVWIRDNQGTIVGAICINVDQRDIRLAHSLLGAHIAQMPTIVPGSEEAPAPPLTTFAKDVDEFVTIALETVLQSMGKPAHQWSRADRVQAIEQLDRQGIFQMRYSVETVARQIGVSRASVFGYLREARSARPDGEEPAQ